MIPQEPPRPQLCNFLDFLGFSIGNCEFVQRFVLVKPDRLCLQPVDVRAIVKPTVILLIQCNISGEIDAL